MVGLGSGSSGGTTGAITGATNGLCSTDGRTVCLGGTLTALGARISHNNSTGSYFVVGVGNIAGNTFGGTIDINRSTGCTNNNCAWLGAHYGSSNLTGIHIIPSGITVCSSSSGFKGIVYNNDFSINYTNRSLVDKEYLNKAISGGTAHEICYGGDAWVYFGNPNTDGTWKFGVSGGSFIHQVRQSGNYVTKHTIAP
jgi:hypothetical protein